MRQTAACVLVCLATWPATAQVGDFELQAAYCLGARMKYLKMWTPDDSSDCSGIADKGRQEICQESRASLAQVWAEASHLRAYLLARGFETPSRSGGDAGDLMAMASGSRDQERVFTEGYTEGQACLQRCKPLTKQCMQQCYNASRNSDLEQKLARCNDLLKALPF